MQAGNAATQTLTGARQVEADAKRDGSGAEREKTEANPAGTKTARENPLIPNQRLRRIYLVMAQARALEKALPEAKRGRAIGPDANRTTTVGLEACLVSAAADLGPGDLVSDALEGGAVDFLRGTALSEVLQPGKADRSRKRRASVSGMAAECGTAARLPGAEDASERIWAALGAAAALKAAAVQAKVEDKAEGGKERQAGVVVAYLLAGGLTATQWKKILKFSSHHELPVVFAILPEWGGKARSTRTGGVSALALGCGVPAIVVDAHDAVAIYRVAQESIGHARIGGGPALMECVPFTLGGAAGKARVKQDAITGLERYMVRHSVATRAWMEREAKAFAKRVAR